MHRFIRQGGAREFYNIDGSVQFAVDIFVEYFQFFLDGNQDPNVERDVYRSEFDSLILLYMVAYYLFRRHPAVQDLYWDANITTMLFQLSKLKFKNLPVCGEDFYIYSNLCESLFCILRVSARERTKFRELGGVNWITELSPEMMAVQSEDARKRYDKLKKNLLNVQQVIIGEQQE